MMDGEVIWMDGDMAYGAMKNATIPGFIFWLTTIIPLLSFY